MNLKRTANVAADLLIDDCFGTPDLSLPMSKDMAKEMAEDSVTCETFFHEHPQITEDAGLIVLLEHVAARWQAARLSTAAVRDAFARHGIDLTVAPSQAQVPPRAASAH